jgi:hypothetical protein
MNDGTIGTLLNDLPEDVPVRAYGHVWRREPDLDAHKGLLEQMRSDLEFELEAKAIARAAEPDITDDRD